MTIQTKTAYLHESKQKLATDQVSTQQGFLQALLANSFVCHIYCSLALK